MENDQRVKFGVPLNVSVVVYDGREHRHLYQLADNSPNSSLDELLVKVAEAILERHKQPTS